MKLVINRCYGGFGLSVAATKRWAELKGRECYFYVYDRSGDRINLDRLVRTTSPASEFVWHAYDIPDADVVLRYPKPWLEMTSDEIKEHNILSSKHSLYCGNIPRNDPELVRVVEELGDSANDSHSELRVVEVPDNVQWEIDEYDGIESVHEAHRVWR